MKATKSTAYFLGVATLLCTGCCCNQPGGWGGSTYAAPGTAAYPQAYPAPVYGAAPAGAAPVGAAPVASTYAAPPPTASIPATAAPTTTTTLR